MSEGDPRLGMFENDVTGFGKVLDRQALKSIGAVPAVESEVVETKLAVDKQAERSSSPIRRSTRPTQPPASLKIYQQTPWLDYPEHEPTTPSTDPVSLLVALTESELQTITPKSPDQVLRSKSRAQWLAAMNREKACHVKNGTFGEEWDSKKGPCPKPIPAGWVFKVKHRGAPIEEKALQAKQFKARDSWVHEGRARLQ